MRGLQKSKRVSWASDVNLCQVRLFLSEESPSQAGLGAQDHLQAKISWALHPTGVGSDGNFPPGFEGTLPANLLRNKLSQIPLIKWICPSRFMLDLTWQVTAGEESEEMEVQNQREMRVLEAVYPRPSAIPMNPSMLATVEDSSNVDQHTPLIPLTPIEDEDAATGASCDSVASTTVPIIPQPQRFASGTRASQCNVTTNLNPIFSGNLPTGMVRAVAPEALRTAYTALTAATSHTDQGNLIDHELLLKIFSDPKFIEKLVASHGTATNPQIILPLMQSGVTISDSPPVQVNRTETFSSLSAATSTGPFHPPPTGVLHVSNFWPPPPEVVPTASLPMAGPAKDINYYKSLIQQHGGEKEALSHYGSRHNHHLGAIQESVNNSRARDLRPRIMKPCMYFNSPRGCRHGVNCVFQHDTSSLQRGSSVPEAQGVKRMKMDRGITGT